MFMQIMLSDGKTVALESSARTEITEIVESMAKQSLRCLAFACKTQLGPLADYDGDHHPSHKLLLDPSNYTPLESDLIWLGVAGLQDPPRPEVASAIAECHAAGIHVSILADLLVTFCFEQVDMLIFPVSAAKSVSSHSCPYIVVMCTPHEVGFLKAGDFLLLKLVDD